MEIEERGRSYKLSNYDFSNGKSYQTLTFIKKLKTTEGSINILNGTTNEEVLEVMLDRFKFLNEERYHAENDIVIQKLKDCLNLINQRKDKLKRLKSNE